jgi:GNAT superfamily N-acetyltransferase
MKIRDAVPEDAPAACEVIRRSIIELCIADHHNDPAILERWLANKTADIVASWIRQPGNSVLLAVEGNAVLAVGSVTDEGEITLNYVSPEARFRGVSRAMITALETRAAERGNERCILVSTETARRFYRNAGYTEEGPPQRKFGTAGSYPMSKQLAVIRLEPVLKALPAGFDALRAEARAEGYRFVERLAADWASGELRFDRLGEVLLAAYTGNELAAIGGLTLDPVVPETLRMRRFYVRERYRRFGIGRRLATALLERAAQAGRPVTVNAASGSAPFWEILGFVSDLRDGHTHVLRPDPKPDRVNGRLRSPLRSRRQKSAGARG